MPRPYQYYARLQTARGSLGTLPPLAQSVVMIFAIPGIALLLLSIAAGLVSIFVLLLLTVPVYRVLQAVFGVRQPMAGPVSAENALLTSLFGQVPVTGGQEADSPGRKQVDAKISDAE